jgi:hypothetical protein
MYGALEIEVGKARLRLDHRRRDFAAAIAAFVTASPEYRALHEAHERCWAELRGIRKALALCQNRLPQAHPRVALAWQHSYPVDEFDAVGVPLDPAFGNHWAMILDELQDNPDCPLLWNET